jgi:hypothetical protein
MKRYYRWRMGFEVSTSSGGSNSTAMGGQCVSNYATDAGTISTGIVLTAATGNTSTRHYTLSIPALSISASQNGNTGYSGYSAHLEFADLALYRYMVDAWLLTWSDLVWICTGCSDVSFGSGFLGNSYLPASGIPLLGCFPAITANAATPIVAPCFSDPPYGTPSTTVVGGYSFKETSSDASYLTHPVSISLVSPPTPSGCQCATPTLSFPSGTTTNNLTVTKTVTGAGGGSYWDEVRGCTVWAIPNLPRSITRMGGDDYAAGWRRGAFPQTLHYSVYGLGLRRAGLHR